MVAVLAAGFGAGFVLTAVGAGSLVSFPILIGAGLSPLVANVCNNVGLIPGGLTGALGFRRELLGTAGGQCRGHEEDKRRRVRDVQEQRERPQRRHAEDHCKAGSCGPFS